MAEMKCIEHWKPVKGYEGFYEVSNMGNVRALERHFIRENGNPATYKGRATKQHISRQHRYFYVCLWMMGRGARKKVSRLVGEAFLAASPKDLVDHGNRCRADDRSSNLRVADTSQNGFNSKLRRDNKSGARGVSWHIGANKWAVWIKAYGTQYYLGHFDDLEDAKRAYSNAQNKYHGEFSSDAGVTRFNDTSPVA